MRDDFEERIIRYADLTPGESECLPVGHREGEDLVIELPDWLAIIQEDSQPEGDRFWMYWLHSDGRVIDFTIQHSLEDASAEANVAVPGLKWQDCDVLLPETEEVWRSRLLPRSAIA